MLETITSMSILLCLAAVFWGIPTYLYGKYQVTYIGRPLVHIFWYSLGMAFLYISFGNLYLDYVSGITLWQGIVFGVITIVWLFAPLFYKHEHLTAYERIRYQPTKYFEILLQQEIFLGGLLILNGNWIAFGLMFFALHLPFLLILPKKVIGVTASASLPAGLIFGYLQSLGVTGFLIALSVHLLFYIGLHLILSSGKIPDFQPHKR